MLDGNTKASIGIKPYNPLLDKYLFSYFSSENNKNFLKLNGFIANDGEIIYDPIYRETLGFDKTMNKVFGTTNKFLFGYNKKNPGYSIYNQTKEPLVLPPIKQGKRKPSPHKRKVLSTKNPMKVEVGVVAEAAVETIVEVVVEMIVEVIVIMNKFIFLNSFII